MTAPSCARASHSLFLRPLHRVLQQPRRLYRCLSHGRRLREDCLHLGAGHRSGVPRRRACRRRTAFRHGEQPAHVRVEHRPTPYAPRQQHNGTDDARVPRLAGAWGGEGGRISPAASDASIRFPCCACCVQIGTASSFTEADVATMLGAPSYWVGGLAALTQGLPAGFSVW